VPDQATVIFSASGSPSTAPFHGNSRAWPHLDTPQNKISLHLPSLLLWRPGTVRPSRRVLDMAGIQEFAYAESIVRLLRLPTDTAVPLLPGQAWHFTAPNFLTDSDRITEILHVCITATPSGQVLTVLYRICSSLVPVHSSFRSLILRRPSKVKVYSGSGLLRVNRSMSGFRIFLLATSRPLGHANCSDHVQWSSYSC